MGLHTGEYRLTRPGDPPTAGLSPGKTQIGQTLGQGDGGPSDLGSTKFALKVVKNVELHAGEGQPIGLLKGGWLHARFATRCTVQAAAEPVEAAILDRSRRLQAGRNEP